MKKNRPLVCLMAILLLVSTFVTTASAANVHTVNDEVTVYVDDKKVTRVDAYLDGNGNVCVDTVEELYRILPDLEEEVYVLPYNDEGYIVVSYLSYLPSYSHYYRSNVLYIYTDEDIIDLKDVINNKPTSVSASVFVNGMRVSTESAFVSNGEAYVSNFDDVYAIFPNETKNTYLPFTNEVTSLKDWASRYKYTYILSGNKVYLNNDGQTPIQVTVNGTIVDFPDQQPVIVPPGRTMVPVRFIAELTGAEVTWDGEHNRVIIQSNYNKLILWIGNSNYWLNGYYYKMDVAPYVYNCRTMVPIRFISEAFGYIVQFDNSADVGVVKLSSGW